MFIICTLQLLSQSVELEEGKQNFLQCVKGSPTKQAKAVPFQQQSGF